MKKQNYEITEATIIEIANAMRKIIKNYNKPTLKKYSIRCDEQQQLKDTLTIRIGERIQLLNWINLKGEAMVEEIRSIFKDIIEINPNLYIDTFSRGTIGTSGGADYYVRFTLRGKGFISIGKNYTMPKPEQKQEAEDSLKPQAEKKTSKALKLGDIINASQKKKILFAIAQLTKTLPSNLKITSTKPIENNMSDVNYKNVIWKVGLYVESFKVNIHATVKISFKQEKIDNKTKTKEIVEILEWV